MKRGEKNVYFALLMAKKNIFQSFSCFFKILKKRFFVKENFRYLKIIMWCDCTGSSAKSWRISKSIITQTSFNQLLHCTRNVQAYTMLNSLDRQPKLIDFLKKIMHMFNSDYY